MVDVVSPAADRAARWHRLTGLPARAVPASAVVACRLGAALTQRDFAAQVAAWRDALAARPGARWALYMDDTFDFACALFGAWHAGKTVIVPGDMQDDTVARLRAACDGFLGELPGALARPPVDAAARVDLRDWPALDEQATQLVVYTSGTNGEPLAIPKRLAQLDAEVHALETRFGTMCETGLAPVDVTPADVASADAGPARPDEAGPSPLIWATVTHQHIYGLLLRVLWPLAAGRAFVAERLVFNEEIALRIAGPAVLVASPAHLRRLPEALDWSSARAGLRAVFSSGGPLPPEAADSVLALLGTAPVEVYGSSETGGVAWRQRVRHGDTWQPLPGVSVRIDDGQLSVRSPHLWDASWWRTADRAVAGGDGMDGFELQGRADRIVKIEEKRVSLTALEQRLREGGEIADVRVLMLASAGTDSGTGTCMRMNAKTGARSASSSTSFAVAAPAETPASLATSEPAAAASRPAVVAVLSDAGRAALSRLGKPAFVARLRTRLLAAVDRVALPRRWRFVEALPVNAQGKSTEALLAALFQPASSGAVPAANRTANVPATGQGSDAAIACAPAATATSTVRPSYPVLDWLVTAPTHAVATLMLTPDLMVFDGHFDSRSILPGVAQVDWAIVFARQRFALPPVFLRLEALKFSQPAGPGTRLEIEWRWDAAKGHLQFEIRSDAGRHSSGRVVFGAAPAAEPPTAPAPTAAAASDSPTSTSTP